VRDARVQDVRGWSARVLAVLIRLLPPHRRDLGRALLAELPTVPPDRRAAWLAGGLWFVVRECAMRMFGYLLGLAGAIAALVTVDRLGTSDDSAKVSLLVLLVGAGLLGFAAPRWAWFSALLLGSSLAVADMLVPSSADLGPGPATLFVLVVPAMVGAYVGVGATWLRRR
jgi:hypothetical protein